MLISLFFLPTTTFSFFLSFGSAQVRLRESADDNFGFLVGDSRSLIHDHIISWFMVAREWESRGRLGLCYAGANANTYVVQ